MTTEYRIELESEEDCYNVYRATMLVDGEEVGEATVMYTEGDDEAYIERIDIEEGQRGKGYGTEFLYHLSSEYGWVVVCPDNEDARRLYERIGDEYRADYPDQGYGIYRI